MDTDTVEIKFYETMELLLEYQSKDEFLKTLVINLLGSGFTKEELLSVFADYKEGV